MPKTLFMKLVKGIPQTPQELHSALGMCASAKSPLYISMSPSV